MASLADPGVQHLLDAPNHAVVSTYNADGSIHGTVVWVNVEDGTLAVNSATGRVWLANLERDPRLSLVVYDQSNPYHYVEVRGTAAASTEGADGHIDRLAKKYLGADSYPYRQPGEQRVSLFVAPECNRLQKQG